MSKAKNQLTIVRFPNGVWEELTRKNKPFTHDGCEYFEYTICKTPFDVARYIQRAKQDRQRALRHRGIPSVK